MSDADAGDLVTDFNKAEGDILDLKDLLTGETASNLATSFLNFQNDSAGHTVLTIHANGASDASDLQTITFNTNLFTEFGATDGNTADIITKM